jgi:hypothetical protein
VVSLAPPDYVEPFSGWRIWTVVIRAGRARLQSPTSFDDWTPREAFVAECTKGHRERLRPWRMHRNAHTPPEDGCTCGVYAMFNPGDLAHFFRTTVMGPRVHYHVFGRVFLWGDVVEADRGWRASTAYPAELWLPEMDYHIARSVGLTKATAGLEDYGLPLHVRGDIAPRKLLRELNGGELPLEETRRRRTRQAG